MTIFDELAEVYVLPPRCDRYQQSFYVEPIDPRRAESTLLQEEMDASHGVKPPPYRHWWMAWELMRRSRLHYVRLMGDAAQRAEAGHPQDGGDKSVSDRPPYPPAIEVPRGYSFPAPVGAEDEPATDARTNERRERSYRALRMLLGHLLRPPVILDEAGRRLPWLAPSSDFVTLHVHVDARPDDVFAAIRVALQRRRHDPNRGSTLRRMRVSDIWGEYSPGEAIQLLDSVAAGAGLRPATRALLRRRQDLSGDGNMHPVDEAELRERFHKAGLRVVRRLMVALRENPLEPIAGRPRAT